MGLRICSFFFLAAQGLGKQFIDEISCSKCQSGIKDLQKALKEKQPLDSMVVSIKDNCVDYTEMPEEVCLKIAKSVGGEVYYIMTRITLSSKQICSFLAADACGKVKMPWAEWDIVLPETDKPPPTTWPVPKAGADTFKVLQISDIHLDPYYAEGSNAECGLPLCCRLNSTAAKEVAKAGKWGDYRNCDTPNITIYNMFDHINRNHSDIDYIILMGDLVSHDIWNNTREENLMTIQNTIDQMRAMFPNVPVFPTMGNLDSSPANSYAPWYVHNELSTKWLYDAMARHWSYWLPDDTFETIQHGGFYSVLVRPGFRIISLNMNFCYNLNWWLLLDSHDPGGQLEWLVFELQNAEFNNEKVHVIGHVPPGKKDCLEVWSRNYYKIVTRFESTIAAQFFSHTHHDEFQVFFDPMNLSRPTNIAYIAPAVTPFENSNPSYRIYYIDGDHEFTTRAVVDHETWVMDLSEANHQGILTWYKEYSALNAYNMNSLSPAEWADFGYRMKHDASIFEMYYLFYYKSTPEPGKCNKSCRKQLVCDTRCGRSYDAKTLCRGFL